MPMRVECPRCRAQMNLGDLEFHLRLELNYFVYRCSACSVNLASLPEARTHFQDRFIPHLELEGADVQSTYLVERRDAVKDAELNRLYDLAVSNATKKKVAEAKLSALKRQRARAQREEAKRIGQILASETIEDVEVVAAAVLDKALKTVVATEAAEEEERALEAEIQDGRRRSRRKCKRPVRLSEEKMVDVVAEAELLGTRRRGGRGTYKRRKVKEPPAPQIGDGKVACLLCGARHARHTFHHHAFRAHMTARPFACALCPYQARESSKLKKHQRGLHHITMGPGTYTNSTPQLRAEISARIIDCFGPEHGSINHARFTCKACGVEVERRYLNVHAAKIHLKEVTYSCCYCQFTSLSWWRDEMRTHLKNAHGNPEPHEGHHYQSHLAQLMPVVKGIVKDLFDV